MIAPHRFIPFVARNISALVLAGVIAVPISGGVSLAEGRDTARVMMLDYCVMEGFRKQRSSEGVVKRCRCAADKAIAMATPSDIGSVEFGRALPRSLRRALAAAEQSCS